MKKFFAAIFLTFGVALALTACSTAAQEATPLSSGTVVIDVRTPAEFAAGHLDGAVNIDVQSPSFAAEVGTFPSDGSYFLYCKSGNRAGQAASQLATLGFTDVTNGGSLEAASATTGIAIVTTP